MCFLISQIPASELVKAIIDRIEVTSLKTIGFKDSKSHFLLCSKMMTKRTTYRYKPIDLSKKHVPLLRFFPRIHSKTHFSQTQIADFNINRTKQPENSL